MVHLVIDDLDKKVGDTYKMKDFQSLIVSETKVLYFKSNGQLLVEFEIDQAIEDFSGYHLSVKEFDYTNKLSG